MKLLPLLLLMAPLMVSAQTVYRCPGPPVLYTDAISAKEAEAKGCRSIEGAPISVVQTPKRAPSPPRSEASAERNERDRVDPNVQKARDSDRRAVLDAELRSAEARLADLKREFADGNPERRGDERNYAKYQERVAELKAAIARQESDIQALKRELAKVP
jgi:predicted RNase H-like nuclease (RuvC/YqgF family)